MEIEFAKIAEAFEFVCAGQISSHSAVIDTTTGDILFQSDSGELNEFPEDVDDERYIFVPTRHELHLGRPLVMSFIEEHIPGSYREVEALFGHKGAYSRFKDFLDLRNQLDHWHEYQDRETEKALREWCEGMGISLRG